MNSPRKKYSFDIERAIATWRQFLISERSVSDEDLKELEAHLRDEIDYVRRPGMSDEEIYRRALQSVGDYATIGRAYRAVFWEKRISRDRIRSEVEGSLSLIGSYVKTAWRSVVRHRAYALLNISGLAVALAACLVIGIFIHHSLSYDRWFEDSARIVRIEWIDSKGTLYASCHPGMAHVLAMDFPEVASVTEAMGSRGTCHGGWIALQGCRAKRCGQTFLRRLLV